MFCGLHPQRLAIGQCSRCGQGICTECQISDHGQIFCHNCSGFGWGAVSWQGPRNAFIPTLLAIFLPGMGQVYNGQIGKGIFVFLTSWLIIPWVYGILDAFMIARKINRGEIPSSTSLSSFLGCLFLMLMFIASPFVFGTSVKQYIFAIQIALNERDAQHVLRQIAEATENYVNLYKRYPLSYSDLYFHKPPLITELYCDVSYNEYVFSCLFSDKGYSLKAVPADQDKGIKKSYLMTTGKNLTVLKGDVVTAAPVVQRSLSDFSLRNELQDTTDKLKGAMDNLQK